MDTIEKAIMEFREGKMLVVVDDDDRENEGDLIVAARHASPEAIAFMARNACGLICVAADGARLDELGIAQMTAENTDSHGTAFAISVDHAKTGTGISAADRSLTIRALVDPAAGPRDFRRPGHVFPLAARSGGVLERRGHTETAVELSRLAFADEPEAIHAGAICEIMNEDGTMARLPELTRFAAERGLSLISVEDLAKHVAALRAAETANAANGTGGAEPSNPGSLATRETKRVRLVASARLPTRYGEFRLSGYRDAATGSEHVALAMGDLSAGGAVLCRVHSECLTGDALGSARCDCGDQYDRAMREIAREGRGVLVYLRQEGRGIGLLNKIRAYALQDAGADTVDANVALGFAADEREYGAAASILANLGVGEVRLMTNNPDKVERLEALGVKVAERVPIIVGRRAENEFYLITKERRMRHRLGEPDAKRASSNKEQA